MDGKKKSSVVPALIGLAVVATIVIGGMYLVQQKRKKDADAITAQAKAEALKQLEKHFDAVAPVPAPAPAPEAKQAPAPAPTPAPTPAPPKPAAQPTCAEAKVKYLDNNPDVKATKLDAWAHYKSSGEREGRLWPGMKCDDPAAFVLAPVAPAPKESSKIADKLKDNAAVIAGNIAKTALGELLPRLIKTLVYGKLKSKVMSRSTMKALTLVSKQLEKLGAKLGEKGLSRLGLMATKKASGIAARIAEQQLLAAGTGPAAPFVDCAMFAFDILTIGLDLGDAGGYDKMGTKKSYLMMKAGIEKELKKTYEENGIPYPAIVGPLDKLSPDDLNSAISDQIAAILTVPDNIYMKPVLDKLAAANLTDPAAIEQFITDNSDLIDMDAVHKVAADKTCVAKGGMVLGATHACSYATKQSCESSYSWPLNDANGDVYAEFHPDAGGPGQPACVSASYALRGICHTNNLPYDSDRGICTIDEKYCLTKSATWANNPAIGEKDCMIPAGQQFAQAIFGTTITNGLNQIFNMDQYSKCVPPAVDDLYSCRTVTCAPGLEASGILGNQLAKASNDLMIAGAATTVVGGAGSVLTGLGALSKTDLCYKPCKENFTGDSFVCWENLPGPPPSNLNCANAAAAYWAMYSDVKNAGIGAWDHFAGSGRAEGRKWPGATCDGSPLAPANTVPDANHKWVSDGAFFRLPDYCPPDKEHQLALCYNRCTKPGYEGKLNNCTQKCPVGGGWRDDGLLTCFKPGPVGRGVGTIPLKRPCAQGLRDDGVSCWKDDSTRGAGRLPDKTPCPQGLRDDGTSCWADDSGRGAGYAIWDGDKCRKHYNVSCKKCLAMYYPPCPDGYKEIGCNICQPPGGPGIKKTLFDRQFCRADEDKNGALCYPKCPSDKHAVGCCLCSPNDGGPGIRTTLMQRQYCEPGKVLEGGLCQNVCKPGYHAVGESICSPDCPPGMVDLGISCGKDVYARDAGVPDTTIRVRDSYTRGAGEVPTGFKISLKKRIVPFSNKSN